MAQPSLWLSKGTKAGRTNPELASLYGTIMDRKAMLSPTARRLWPAAALGGGLALLRVGLGAAFACHASRIVFHRRMPVSLAALRAVLRVTRPLAMAWRFLTAGLRCLPDVYILGEVRCGTTSTAAMLRDHLDMVGPFTPWVHPL